MKPWKRLDDGNDVVSVGQYRKIVRKKFTMNSGHIIDADIFGEEGTAAAGVVALTKDNQVIVAKQFRCGPEKLMYEIPGGGVEYGENPQDAATRELLEEVGYQAGAIEHIGDSYVNAWDNRIHHYYLAIGCVKIKSPTLDITEEVEVMTIPISKFIDNAFNAKMNDVQAVLFAYDRLRRMEKQS